MLDTNNGGDTDNVKACLCMSIFLVVHQLLFQDLEPKPIIFPDSKSHYVLLVSSY